MSQLTKSADLNRPITDATGLRFAIFFLAIATAVLALAAAFAAIETMRADEQPAAVPALIGPGSRADDYGLRHPVQQTSSDTRLDDYGLRHPVQQTSSDTRLDDYGLRHPVP
jgi:hypothetical protein